MGESSSRIWSPDWSFVWSLVWSLCNGCFQSFDGWIWILWIRTIWRDRIRCQPSSCLPMRYWNDRIRCQPPLCCSMRYWNDWSVLWNAWISSLGSIRLWSWLVLESCNANGRSILESFGLWCEPHVCCCLQSNGNVRCCLSPNVNVCWCLSPHVGIEPLGHWRNRSQPKRPSRFHWP